MKQPVQLADRQELVRRRAKLVAVDLEATAANFRSRSGSARKDTWEQLEPVLLGALRHSDKPLSKAETAAALKRWLGEPDSAAFARYGKMGLLLEDPLPDDRLCYFLTRPNDSFVHVLIIDLREGRLPSCSIVAGG